MKAAGHEKVARLVAAELERRKASVLIVLLRRACAPGERGGVRIVIERERGERDRRIGDASRRGRREAVPRAQAAHPPFPSSTRSAAPSAA